MAYKLGMNDAAIQSAIISIGKRSASLKQDIQITSACIMLNLKKSGDYPTATRLANALVKALGNGMRSKSLMAHFELHAPMVYNKETKELVRGSTAASPVKSHAEINDTAVVKNLWDEAISEPEYKPIADFGALVAQLIKKGEADREKLGDASKVTDAQLKALAALVA